MIIERLQGLFPPMVVPFTQMEELDEDAFRKDARYLLNTGVDGISSGGTTGQGAVLSNRELLRCLEIIQEENSAGKPLIAGIIKDSTREVIAAAKDAKKAGADALLVTPVYYHGADDQGNLEFFQRIAGETGMPVIIYNVVAVNLISPALFDRIAEIDGILGIKQVDPVKLSEIAAVHGETSHVYTACDQLLYSSYAAGACGAISALLTIAPELTVVQWRAFKAGDQQKAMEIQKRLVPLVQLYLERPFSGKIKQLITLQGREVGYPRHPTLLPDDTMITKMKIRLKAAGLIE